jgi:hypothetical protein
MWFGEAWLVGMVCIGLPFALLDLETGRFTREDAMVLGLICLLVAGVGGNADRDSVRLSDVTTRLPADIQAKLQARKAKGLDSARVKDMMPGQVSAQSRRNALEERERMLKSLPPQERMRMEAALKDMERLHQERLQAMRQRREVLRLRE